MAFDQDKHGFDQHGFQIDKASGHRIGLDPAPAARVSPDKEYPKWVTPHPSHIVRKETPDAPEHVSTPQFPQFHIDRLTKAVTVLVADAKEEAKALAELVVPKADEASE
jgi:hypothetical protein